MPCLAVRFRGAMYVSCTERGRRRRSTSSCTAAGRRGSRAGRVTPRALENELVCAGMVEGRDRSLFGDVAHIGVKVFDVFFSVVLKEGRVVCLPWLS